MGTKQGKSDIRNIFVVWLFVRHLAKGCDIGWYRLKESCYLFESTYQNFAGAGVHCSTLKSHMVEINSYVEELYVRQMAKANGINHYWLGGSNKAYEGRWMWVSSSQPISYFNWRNGETNNYRNNEHCVSADGISKGWNDVSCTLQYQFVCEGEYKETIEIPPDDSTTIETNITTTIVNNSISTSGVVTPSTNESDYFGGNGMSSPQVTVANATDSTGNATLTGSGGSPQEGTSNSNNTLEPNTTPADQETATETSTSVSTNAITSTTIMDVLHSNTQSQTQENLIQSSDSLSTSLPVSVTRNDGMTTQSPATVTSQFICAFYSVDCCSKLETFEDIKRLILEHRLLLLINKTDTSKFQRTLRSAVDNRPSATGLGLLGGVLLAGVGVVIISIDATRLLRFVRTFCRAKSRVHDSTLG